MVERQSVSVETLKAIADAFNAHDLDAIMEFFADDCSLTCPVVRSPGGSALRAKPPCARFGHTLQSLPDVHYSDDRHWVSGNMGVSECC